LRGFEKQAGLSKFHDLPKHIQEGIRSQHVSEGAGFLSAIPLWAAGKVLGKKRLVKFLKAVQKPGLHVDTTLGHYADKLTSKLPKGYGQDLFKTDEHIKVHNIGGPRTYEIHKRKSLVAPLSKATEIAKPIVFGLAMEKGLRDFRKKRDEQRQQQY